MAEVPRKPQPERPVTIFERIHRSPRAICYSPAAVIRQPRHRCYVAGITTLIRGDW